MLFNTPRSRSVARQASRTRHETGSPRRRILPLNWVLSPELSCVPSPNVRKQTSGGCRQWTPEMVQCYNMGSDGTDAAWKCEASMPEGYSFSSVEVKKACTPGVLWRYVCGTLLRFEQSRQPLLDSRNSQRSCSRTLLLRDAGGASGQYYGFDFLLVCAVYTAALSRSMPSLGSSIAVKRARSPTNHSFNA